MQFNYPELFVSRFKKGDILSVYPTCPAEYYHKLTQQNRESWDKYLESNPQLQVEPLKAKITWQTRRLTCKIQKIKGILGWDIELHLIVLWSNIPEIIAGMKLFFQPPRDDDLIYRTASSLHIPEEDRAEWTAYKYYREGDIWNNPSNRRTYYKKHVVKESPVLTMKTEHGSKSLHPNEMECKTPELTNFCEHFFNKWTFVYKIQGEFIEYIERLALKLNGKPSPRFDDNGFFTMGLQRDEVLNADGDLQHIEPQNVVWSTTYMHNRECNYAYFPFSGMQADSITNIEKGQLISNTNANVSQIICFRKNIRNVNNARERTFPRKQYIITVDNSIICGPNPGILIEKCGDEHEVYQHTHITRPIDHYRFTRPGVQTYILNELNSELHSTWLQATGHSRYNDKRKLYNKSTRMSAPERGLIDTNEHVALTTWHGTYFVEHEPKHVLIILPEEKINKTIFKAREYISFFSTERLNNTLLNDLTIIQIFYKKAVDSLAPGNDDGIERSFFKYVENYSTRDTPYPDGNFLSNDEKTQMANNFIEHWNITTTEERFYSDQSELEDWVKLINEDDELGKKIFMKALKRDYKVFWPNRQDLWVHLAKAVRKQGNDLNLFPSRTKDIPGLFIQPKALNIESLTIISYNAALKSKTAQY